MMQRVLLIVHLFYSFFATAGDTVLKLYRPYGDVVEQSPAVAKMHLAGECFTQSQLIKREDAWRCQAQGAYYDPCFVKIGGKKTTVLCPQSPWIGDSVEITLSAPLNNEHHATLDMSRAWPWAIELASGEQCQAIEPNETYDSMPIRYRCGSEHVLIGYLQRCKSVWSMLEKRADGVKSVDFRRVWF